MRTKCEMMTRRCNKPVAAPFWTPGDQAIITAVLAQAFIGLAFASAWAQVAQLVEHCTENAGVGGSIPPLGTITRLPGA